MHEYDKIISRPDLYKMFKKVLSKRKVLYIGAQCGWGKTTAVLDWLDNNSKKYTYLSAMQDNFGEALSELNGTLVVIDDLQAIGQSPVEHVLAEKMGFLNGTRFILIGRSELPSFLIPFQMTSQLTTFGPKDFEFSREQIQEALKNNNLFDLQGALDFIQTNSKNYPLAVLIMCRKLKDGGKLDEGTIQKTYLDIYKCFDILIFNRFDNDLQKFMLSIGSFEFFTENMAEMITGKRKVISLINKAMSIGNYLTLIAPGKYQIKSLFHKYLKYKQHLECSVDVVNFTYHNAGLYYELKGDIANALKCYKKSEETQKISELLIENSELHPGKASYYATEEYYYDLPEKTILASPALISGMCILTSLCCRSKESERWYNELKTYIAQVDKRNSNYNYAILKLAYLDIALPHRDNETIFKNIKLFKEKMGLETLKPQEFSVTCCTPSILHGGKDFVDCADKVEYLYINFKEKLEKVFGHDGVGLADVVYGEVLYEQYDDKDISSIMILLNSGMNAAAFGGTLEIEFAAVGSIVRIMMMNHNLNASMSLIKGIKQKSTIAKQIGLIANIEAFETRINLILGNTIPTHLWLENNAPDENLHFHVLDRYKYMIKIRCYLQEDRNMEAYELVSKMIVYCESYKRTYELIEAEILFAIIQYRLKQTSWMAMLNKALLECEKYKFIRLPAEEGVAIQPLINKAKLETSAIYNKKLKLATARQAIDYPDYLKSSNKLYKPLTETEKIVLKLLCKGLSNNEISKLMNVTIRTVKFHTSNIYSKMNVKSRTQAIKLAGEILNISN